MALFAVAGCPSNKETTDAPATKKEPGSKSESGDGNKSESSSSGGDTKPTETPAPSPSLQPDPGPSSAPGGGVAKGELDGREPDADFSGTSLTAGRVSYTAHKEWKKDS